VWEEQVGGNMTNASTTTYFWVGMKGTAEPIIMARIAWSDKHVEWVRPGSFALWELNKDFEILEKVPDYIRLFDHLCDFKRREHGNVRV
jgi:hypothetical protein